MAVVVSNLMGRVDVPPQIVGNPGTPQDLAAFLVEITIQAADYSTGIVLTNIATACGFTTVIGCLVVNARIAAGTTLLGFSVHDQANNKVRFLTAITNQTTATDYTAVNGDVFRLLIIGV